MSELLQPADLRALGVETDVDDDGLQILLDAAEADLLAHAGPIQRPLDVEESGVDEIHLGMTSFEIEAEEAGEVTVPLTAAEVAAEEARRKVVLLAVVKLDLAYDGSSQTGSGAFSQVQLAYTQERGRLLGSLASTLFS